MTDAFIASPQMWATLCLTGLGLIAFAHPRLSLELTSLVLIVALILLFHFAPMPGAATPDASDLLSGLGNPALIAVVALVVVGQGMVRTGALDWASNSLYRLSRGRPGLAIALGLSAALAISAVLNNTPVVVMFIPILAGLAGRVGQSARRVLMPLSFAAGLGGNLTLIGSSTNMMAAASLGGLGVPPLRFFDFTLPGLVVAAVGLGYVLVIAPRLLPSSAREPVYQAAIGRQFIARIVVESGDSLDGTQAVGGLFSALKRVTVLIVEQGTAILMAPFEDVTLAPGDVIVVAATRAELAELLARRTHAFQPLIADDAGGETASANRRYLAETMVPPDSRLVGLRLAEASFPLGSGVAVLGIQRRTRMSRTNVPDLRLEAGDVLLVQGRHSDVQALRAHRDVVLMEWSGAELPAYDRAFAALAIFVGMVALSASGVVPIEVGAIAAVVLMIATGCLDLRQAVRAVDRQIFLIGAASLALDQALRATGGAAYVAMGFSDGLAEFGVPAVLSGLFLIIAVIGNFLSNNASAVLFTPIAVGIAQHLGADPLPFIVAVIFASSASYATPVGYVTNLLVMAPGRYNFLDFLRVGGPLTILVWIAFSLFAPWYYGL